MLDWTRQLNAGDLHAGARCRGVAVAGAESACGAAGGVGLAAAYPSLGYIAELRHDDLTAERDHRASLDAACEAADRRAQALALEGLAGVASLRNDPQDAGLLPGAAAALRDATVATMLGAAAAAREMTAARLPRQRSRSLPASLPAARR